MLHETHLLGAGRICVLPRIQVTASRIPSLTPSGQASLCTQNCEDGGGVRKPSAKLAHASEKPFCAREVTVFCNTIKAEL